MNGIEGENGREFIIGNLIEQTLDEIAQSTKLKALYKNILKGVEQCKDTCDFYQICGGGQLVSRYAEKGNFFEPETTNCRFRIKIPASVLVDELEKRISV